MSATSIDGLPPQRDTVNLPDAAAGIDAIAKLAVNASGFFYEETVDLGPSVTGLPQTINVLARSGETPEIIPLRQLFEPFRTAPERRRGTAVTTTLASFIALTNRHKDADSALFAKTEWPAPSLAAVIDYHRTDGVARFGEHRVNYAFPLTPEFKEWIEGNGKPMGQGDFASFVEDRIADLAAPYDAEVVEFERLFRTRLATPAEMVDLSRGLQIHVASAVKNHVTQQSGEAEIAFREEHQNAQGEKITVPGVFMVAVRAFVDGEPVRIAARLRYRVKDGKIVWSYQLYKWDYELRERVLDDLRIAATETALPAYEGTPEPTASPAR